MSSTLRFGLLKAMFPLVVMYRLYVGVILTNVSLKSSKTFC